MDQLVQHHDGYKTLGVFGPVGRDSWNLKPERLRELRDSIDPSTREIVSSYLASGTSSSLLWNTRLTFSKDHLAYQGDREFLVTVNIIGEETRLNM